MKKPASEKVLFAQTLRGIACLVVVFYHFGDVFWLRHERVVELANLKPTNFNDDTLLIQFAQFLGFMNINLGALGVALFFLISGFVIPFSLEHSGKVTFLIKRVFRIIPPYAIGLLITVSVVFAYSKYAGLQFPYTIVDYLVNASLLRDWLGFRSIDSINWTLEVEIKFYLLCVLLVTLTTLKNFKALITTALLMLAATVTFVMTTDFLVENYIYVNHLLAVATDSFFYLSFMLVGIGFYNYFKQNWNFSTFAGVTAILLVVSFGILYLRLPDVFMPYGVSYFLAYLTFHLSYQFRHKFVSNKVLDFFADVSYPLYIVHGVVGYTLISVFYEFLPNPYLVIPVALIIVLAISYLLHKYIELPSNQLGKSVAGRYKKIRIAISKEAKV